MADSATAPRPKSGEDAKPNGVILEARDLVKRYPNGEVVAVDGVSLAFDQGSYVSIMGPSGSGKSTLLNLLGGLDTPTSGEVYFRGKAFSSFPSLEALRAAHIGFVFQSFHLLTTLTSLENVQVPMFEGKLRPAEREARARELLDLVHMGHRVDHLPQQMSVGERQRVAIARSLANDPELLLADEPTGNLDSKNGAEVLDLFDKIQQERGVTLIVITHGDEVAQRAHRRLTYRDGKIVGDESR
ncbi:MAG: ABC transporter ATP-binding protein [Planctomycetales bacterium]|nr:ABC transporter ATP-binding protein [Planctomycetales bacterium]